MPLSHGLLYNLDARVAFEELQERRLATADVALDVDRERDVVDVAASLGRRHRHRRRLRRCRHRRQSVGRRENENKPCKQFPEIHFPREDKKRLLEEKFIFSHQTLAFLC